MTMQGVRLINHLFYSMFISSYTQKLALEKIQTMSKTVGCDKEMDKDGTRRRTRTGAGTKTVAGHG